MPRKIGYSLFVFALILFIFSGCTRKEEPGQKKESRAQAGRPTPSTKPITEERVLFSFERDTDGWDMPYWAFETEGHAGQSADLSGDVASEGEKSLRLDTDFPGDTWTFAIVEQEQYFDFYPSREIALDVYIPEDAPMGLRGKIILTVGEKWKFTEMVRSIPLLPGKWVTVRANIEPGSYDWKRTVPDESFRQDVRKIAFRVESNHKPAYKGPVYIDNVRIGK